MLIIAVALLAFIVLAIPKLRCGWYIIHGLILLVVSYYFANKYGYMQVSFKAFFYLLIIHFISINFVTFLAYAYDKAASIEGKWRVPEKILHALALIGGTPLAILSRKIMRHKTKKDSFVRDMWKVIFLQIILLVVVAYMAILL